VKCNGIFATILAYNDIERYCVFQAIVELAEQQLNPDFDFIFYYRPHIHPHYIFRLKARITYALKEFADFYGYVGYLDADVIVRDDGRDELIRVLRKHEDAWIFAMDEGYYFGYTYFPDFTSVTQRMVNSFNLNSLAIPSVLVYVNAGLMLFRSDVIEDVGRKWLWFVESGLMLDGWLEQHALTNAIHFFEWFDRYIPLTPYPCRFAEVEPFEAPFAHIFGSTQYHRLKEFVFNCLLKSRKLP